MKRRILSINKMHTIKNKMMAYSMTIIILMTILSIYSLSITNEYKQQIDEMFVRKLLLTEVSNTLQIVDQELVVYLSTKNSSSLNKYMFYADELKRITADSTAQVLKYTEEELMFLDINNMIYNYLIETEKSVAEKRKSDVLAYTKRYNNALMIKNYIAKYVMELNVRQLDRNAISYIYMSEQIQKSNFLNIVLMVTLILLSFIIVYNMSDNMIKPIVRLSNSAEDISTGNFDTEEIVVETNDEIEILALAFNKMKKSIHAYIEELKEKAYTEAKLKDQEMENFKMQSLLDNARLYALQSQMNPHFLFNTINAGVQLSMIEGANRTSEFLETMSRLFRYNIKKMDSEVSIQQEIENVKDYYELLKVRFGSLITFQFEIEEEGLCYTMPPIVLQPIVENAYIHGLSKKEEGGNIIVRVENQYEITVITIEDNGVGIEQETIDEILSHKGSIQESNALSLGDKKHSNGIGILNVIDRLELYYKQKNLVDIKSEVNRGTKIMISIPHKTRR